MRTNFQMIKDLNSKFKPVQRGVISGSEVEMIKDELCLSEMDILQLRNLRDFVVLYFSRYEKESTDEVLYQMDRCSGICAVIDSEIFSKGGEV